MMRNASRTAVSIFALLTAGLATAQGASDVDDTPDIRRYTVEMIVFRYAQSVSAGSEIFVPDAPPSIADLPLISDGDLSSTPEAAAASSASGDHSIRNRPVNYPVHELTMLDDRDFQLIDVIQRLERLDAYEPLLHFGWTQAMVPDAVPEPRPLSSFVTPPRGLDGELGLYLSRYLHLTVELQLDAPKSSYPNSRDRLRASYDGPNHDVHPIRYRLQEDRIFRNGELRYFDHPKFGVLAKVSRVEEVEEPRDGELLGD